MKRSEKYTLSREALSLMGVPEGEISAERAIAVQCAIEMGYQMPQDVADMAKKLCPGLYPQHAPAPSESQETER